MFQENKASKTITRPPCQTYFNNQQTHSDIRIGLAFIFEAPGGIPLWKHTVRSVSTYWLPVLCLLSIMKMSAHYGDDCSNFKGGKLI